MHEAADSHPISTCMLCALLSVRRAAIHQRHFHGIFGWLIPQFTAIGNSLEQLKETQMHSESYYSCTPPRGIIRFCCVDGMHEILDYIAPFSCPITALEF